MLSLAAMADPEAIRGQLLDEILTSSRAGVFPSVAEFRIAHENDRGVLDEMVADGLLETGGWYRPRLFAIRAPPPPRRETSSTSRRAGSEIRRDESRV